MVAVRAQGNSLFGWTMLFWLACALAILVVALPFLASLRSLFNEEEFHWMGLLSMAASCSWPSRWRSRWRTPRSSSPASCPDHVQARPHGDGGLGAFPDVAPAHPVTFIAYGLLMIVLWAAIGLA